MTRTARFSLRVILVGFILSTSFGASALPLSPKWMKSSVEGKKVNQASGELNPDNVGVGTGGGVVQALPVPASLWLMVIGGLGMTLVRRTKT